MCLAQPTKILTLKDNQMADVELSGVQTEISVAFTPEVKVGDYVVVHVGHALSIIDEEEAQKTLELSSEVYQ